MPDSQMVTRASLIASMPKWWDRLRAKTKVIGTAMTSRRDQIITLSDDRKHIKLVDADKFSAAHQVVGGSEQGATRPAQTEL